jgi:putative colanic acid biosynthesis glycosyltransferase
MKVLLVNCVYGNGSTGKILSSLHHGLIRDGWDSFVRYARGPLSDEKNVRKLSSEKIVQFQALCSRLTGYTYSCSPMTTSRLKGDIKKLKPDVVNLHCVNANTVNIAEILTFLKKNKIPTVVTAHAEFVYTGGCGHSLECNKWKSGCSKCPQFHTIDSQLPVSYFSDRCRHYWKALSKAYADFPQLRLTGVSPWLVSRIKQSPFFTNNQVWCTLNGVNTVIFHPREASHLRKLHEIPSGGRIYLHVTPNFRSPLKGGKYMLDFANIIRQHRPDDRLIIIGYNDDDENLLPNIISIRHINNQTELAEYYSLADVTLVPSSRETFSMVTAESLCCGTPVVGFKAGGPESICTRGKALFVEYGDLEALVNSALSIEKDHTISTFYIPLFSEESMVTQYEAVYNSLNYGETD